MTVILEFILLILMISFILHIFNDFYPKASIKLLRETREGTEKLFYVIPMFELVSYERLKRINQNISTRKGEEVKILRASINGELDRLKHFAPLGIIITLIVTVLFAIFGNVFSEINDLNKLNYRLALEQKIDYLKEEGTPSDQIAHSLLEDFEIDSEFKELAFGTIENQLEEVFKSNIITFGIFFIVLMLYWFIYQFRLSRLLKLKYILDEQK